ncbi:hypothetical protein V6N11_049552 [Hibiscus sabdariffa]|uniref:Uncharacterized protein n=1 Tax=Hibiscus sabdariffa TaxID=183260 RepID=A0ABR2NMR2_9ROSI
MGDRTDRVILHFFVSDDGFDSWWCESRSRLQLGRRLVRLETPSPGGRHPFHCRQVWNETSGDRVSGGCSVCTHLLFVLQDLSNWLESSDWYKVKVLFQEGLYASKGCHNDGFVILLGWDQWQSLQGLSFHGLGFKVQGDERRKSDRLWKLSGNGRKNEETGLPKGKEEGEVADVWVLRERDWVLGETGDRDVRRRVGKEMRWILCFGSGNMSWSRRRRWWYTADMGAGRLEKTITCEGSAKGQETCENILSNNWPTWRIEKFMGPTVAAGGTFSETNHFPQNSGPTTWSIRGRLAMQIPKEPWSGHDSPIKSAKKVNRCLIYLGVGAQGTKMVSGKGRHCGAQLPEGERRIKRAGTLILHGMHGIKEIKMDLAANGYSRKEKVVSSVGGVQQVIIPAIDEEREEIEGLKFIRSYSSQKRKEKPFKTSEQSKVFSDNPCSFPPEKSLQESMADEVVGMLENLKFTEDELVDVSNAGEEMMEEVDGAEKWAVGDFQGPFQFGEWIKVDMSKGRMNVRRKPGIVYASRAQGKQDKEETREHMMESLEEEGRENFNLDKGKAVGQSLARSRTVKRTLKGKNEVCNPFTAKKSRTVNNAIGDEDECSEATSPIKNSAQTVEAGSQPRRDQ